MAVASQVSSFRYTGDGVTRTFGFGQPFFDATDLAVTIRRSDGSIEALTYGTQFAVTGGDGEAGSVTIQNNVTVPGISDVVVVTRAPALFQELDLTTQGAFRAEAVEDALDAVVYQVQATDRKASRAPRLAETDLDGSGAYDFNGNRGTNVGAPTASSDVATKGYVDSVTGGGGVVVEDGTVTNAKLASAPALTIKGNPAGSEAVVQDMTVAATRGLLGMGALALLDTVDATRIDARAVTVAKLQAFNTARIAGRTTSGSGDLEQLTGTQATAILDAFTGDTGTGGLKGLVPAPAAGDAAASKFLAADGTWKVGGSSGASAALSYITAASESGLSGERVLTAGTGIAVSDGGANSTFTISIATDGVNNTHLADNAVETAAIADEAVTLAKLADMPTARFIGRTTAGDGVPEALTATQATAILNAMVGDSGSGGVKGLVPAPAAGDAGDLKYLRADGTWAIPAGGGGGSAPETATYLTLTTNGTLTNERIATAGAGISITDAGAGLAATFALADLGVTTGKLAANAVTFAKMQSIATARFVGRTTAGTGVPEELTGTQATALLDAMGGASSGSPGTKGLVPQPGAGQQNSVLNGAGNWVAQVSTSAPAILQTADPSLPSARVLTGSSTVSLTDAGAGSTMTLAVPTNGIALSNLAQVATARFLGRTSSGTGNVEAMTVAEAQALLGIGSSGVVIQREALDYQANTDLSTAIPLDDTIPQSSEGTQILTLSITPTSATNVLRVFFKGQGAAPAYWSAALFLDSETSARDAAAVYCGDGARIQPVVLDYQMIAGTTSTVTFKIRVGPNTGTMRLNGGNASRVFGGVQRCKLIIEEMTP
jgi:hypothetical protein